MIRFSVIHRAKDGLALSASTDMDSGVELRESKRFAKLISRKARQFPVRSWMAVGRFRIFFSTESDCCFLLISESNLQPVLAYNFLEELKKEFLGKFTRGAIEKAVRPYSFIEFDTYIQKTKQRYNSTRTLYTRVSLGEITDELQKNPPHEVTERDLGANAVLPSTLNTQKLIEQPRSVVITSARLAPLTIVGKVSIAMVGMCAVLNLVRLVPFINNHTPGEQAESSLISFWFFLSMLFNTGQCYLLLNDMHARNLLNVFGAIGSLLLLAYLHEYRETIHLAYHFTSNLLIAYSIWKRPPITKLPNYNV